MYTHALQYMEMRKTKGNLKPDQRNQNVKQILLANISFFIGAFVTFYVHQRLVNFMIITSFFSPFYLVFAWWTSVMYTFSVSCNVKDKSLRHLFLRYTADLKNVVFKWKLNICSWWCWSQRTAEKVKMSWEKGTTIFITSFGKLWTSATH